jgi:hypothetical protein
MSRILLAICIFSGTIPALSQAEMLASPSGGQYVIVFKTEDTMNYFIKECMGKGNRIYSDDCISCVAIMTQSGTRCSIIKKSILARKVRIMQGPHNGKVGWVPMEMVRD